VLVAKKTSQVKLFEILVKTIEVLLTLLEVVILRR
jgi:hypothetical protein